MDLERVLPAIRIFRDLSRLIRTLGLEPLWDEVPREAWDRPTDPPTVVVARVADFPWFAVEAPDPVRTARRLARRLATRGRMGGVLVLDVGARELAVAVAFGVVPVLHL